MKHLALTAFWLLCSVGLLPVNAQANRVPRFEAADCPVSFPAGYRVDCGYVVVPEEHAQPDGATIRVMIAIFRNREVGGQPEPLIFLAGGPGSNTLFGAAGGIQDYLDRALKDRDVILLDQRGMGFSEPSLLCPEVDGLLVKDVIGPMAAANKLTVEASQQCFERLVDEGVNVAAFNTVESAADVADIAQALGYDKLNIYGGSYGSTLAMTVMRNHPAIIRSVMLQGITPPQVDLMASFAPDFEYSLNLLLEACATDTNCNSAFPQLGSMFYAIIERFKSEPLKLTIDNPLSHTYTSFIVDDNYFIRGVQSALYNTRFLPQFPLFIAAIYNEQYDPLENLLVNYLGSTPYATNGALYAMRCMDDIMTTTDEDWEESVASINPALQSAFRGDIEEWNGLCPTWGARQLDPVENTPVVSDIPTLILNGAFDPVTPAKWGALAAETLPNSYNYTFPVAGHGVDAEACSMDIFEAFITDPTAAPDTACLSKMPAIQFALP